MKIVFGVLALLIAGGIAFLLFGNKADDSSVLDQEVAVSDEEDMLIDLRSEVQDGSYTVMVDDSKLFWAGKKPLVSGYVNTGSMALKGGSIEMKNGVGSGEFLIDMDTISVSKTPTKPGSENKLESHLKGERWFDVNSFPEAKFVINNISSREDSDQSFVFDVTGDLTMKGETNEISFPASIFIDENGLLRANAGFEFDRTLWGITSGSGSFFDDLADNVIDDMISLTFELVAEEK